MILHRRGGGIPVRTTMIEKCQWAEKQFNQQITGSNNEKKRGGANLTRPPSVLMNSYIIYQLGS